MELLDICPASPLEYHHKVQSLAVQTVETMAELVLAIAVEGAVVVVEVVLDLES